MSTTARVGAAVAGLAVAGVSDMPDFSGNHFTWEGSCWEAVTDPDLDVATMSPSASPVAKEALTARIVQAMSVATKKLVVTEEAILNHATLIGQTVVDDINIQGKLIGRDGTFTGTVDFENVNVTGTQLVNKLAASSISADKISGGDFTGKTFSGGLFAGAEFQAPASPRWNGGIAIDPANGLRAWNTSGKQTVQINPNTGQIMLTDLLKAVNTSNRGVILVPTTSTGGGGLWFSHSGGVGGWDAAIWRSAYEPEGVEPLHLRGANGGHIRIHGGLEVEGGGIMALRGTSNFRDMIHTNPPTGSSAANTHIAGNGRFYKVTSSRRYKRNVVDWSPDPERVLALRPRQWQHDDPAQPEEIDERWHAGFIAEEVHDLGLGRLVMYEGDGAGGWRPEALNYDRFAAAQQVVLQKHEAEIADLRERIALLEQNQEPQ